MLYPEGIHPLLSPPTPTLFTSPLPLCHPGFIPCTTPEFLLFTCTPNVLLSYSSGTSLKHRKSNGSRHSVWGASKNMGNDLMRLFSLCTRFTPGWFVLMVNTHSPPSSLIQPYSNKNPNWYLRIEVKEGLPLANSGFLITSICKVTIAKN